MSDFIEVLVDTFKEMARNPIVWFAILVCGGACIWLYFQVQNCEEAGGTVVRNACIKKECIIK